MIIIKAIIWIHAGYSGIYNTNNGEAEKDFKFKVSLGKTLSQK
jgi:hypothetical protein